MKKISVRSQSHYKQDNTREVVISGLTQTEADQLLCALSGMSWFGVKDGRLEVHAKHLPLLDTTHDEKMLPFWREHANTQVQGELIEKVFEEMSDDVLYYPHFTIQSLCGYYYSPENYAYEAQKLLSYGFVQMRSKRAENGKYWEHWYLPGVFFAKGHLKEIVDSVTVAARSWEDPHGRRKDKECFKAVLEFLRCNVSFGSLDVSMQRYAMATPD